MIWIFFIASMVIALAAAILCWAFWERYDVHRPDNVQYVKNAVELGWATFFQGIALTLTVVAAILLIVALS